MTMGIYCYRITSHKSNLSDGTQANVAVFAYKPSFSSFDAESFNRKMHFRSGAQSSDNAAARGKFFQCRIVCGRINDAGQVEVYPGEAVFMNVGNVGTFYDDDLGSPNLPKIEGVKS